MIHRAPFGSMERFIGVLIEHCSGNFPLWLMPEQVAILPVSDKWEEYGKNVLKLLQKADIRALVDERNETIGKKIRDAEVQRTPVMLILGEQEAQDGNISVRMKGKGDLGKMEIKDFIQFFNEQLENNV